jgi:hypothetical protein
LLQLDREGSQGLAFFVVVGWKGSAMNLFTVGGEAYGSSLGSSPGGANTGLDRIPTRRDLYGGFDLWLDALEETM